MTLLHSYNWPANLTELDTVIRQAHARARTAEIEAGDLPGRLRSAVDLAAMPAASAERQLPLDELLGKTERQLLDLAFRQAKGNLSRAAARLNISRARLYRRLQMFGIIERSRAKEDENSAEETDTPIEENE
jgi:arginine utilization regulatory protein